jgi:hypothetical protein
MLLAANDVAAEFQARRRKTWRLIRPWVFVTATGFVVFFLVFEFTRVFDQLWTMNLIFGSFLVLLLSIARIALMVNKLYRCPACNNVPMGRGRNGVLLDPDACPKCEARLK